MIYSKIVKTKEQEELRRTQRTIRGLNYDLNTVFKIHEYLRTLQKKKTGGDVVPLSFVGFEKEYNLFKASVPKGGAAWIKLNLTSTTLMELNLEAKNNTQMRFTLEKPETFMMIDGELTDSVSTIRNCDFNSGSKMRFIGGLRNA
jgi:hypothetical protein